MSSIPTTSPSDAPPYEPLASPARRHIIRALADDATCTVDDVLDAVAARPDTPARDRIRLRLYHVDLPKLFDAGLIDYDWRSGAIVRTAAAATLDGLHAGASS